MIRPALLAALAVLFTSSVAVAQTPFAGAGEPVAVGAGYAFRSAVLGDERRINVLLPPGYDDPENAAVRYPVLYLLDGGDGWQDFVHIAGMVHQGGTWGANAPLIVVGVESRDRKREFLTPSDDAAERTDFPTHGGADAFRRFLVEELKPAVEARWRTSGVDGLIGESLAGYFVLDTALRSPSAFDRYAAVSPSLWWNGEALSKSAAGRLAAPGPKPEALWMSVADEGGGMQRGVERIVDALKESGSTVRWSYVPYQDETHATVYHPAATRAVRTLFPPAPKPAR